MVGDGGQKKHDSDKDSCRVLALVIYRTRITSHPNSPNSKKESIRSASPRSQRPWQWPDGWLARLFVDLFVHVRSTHSGLRTPYFGLPSNTESSPGHDPGILHGRIPGVQSLHGSRDPEIHPLGHAPEPYQADWSVWGRPARIILTSRSERRPSLPEKLTFRFLPRKTLSFRTSA